jgi:hypothetical protein
MAQIGKFLNKKFLNKEVELYIGNESEWINYSDSSTINISIVCGIVKEYDAECGILTMASVFDGSLFYICEDTIQMVWEPGFKASKTIKSMLNTGSKLYQNKYRDIM